MATNCAGHGIFVQPAASRLVDLVQADRLIGWLVAAFVDMLRSDGISRTADAGKALALVFPASTHSFWPLKRCGECRFRCLRALSAHRPSAAAEYHRSASHPEGREARNHFRRRCSERETDNFHLQWHTRSCGWGRRASLARW